MRMGILLCFLLLTGVALAQDKPEKSYPEQGTANLIQSPTTFAQSKSDVLYDPYITLADGSCNTANGPTCVQSRSGPDSGNNRNNLRYWYFINSESQIFTVLGSQEIGTVALFHFRVEGKALFVLDGKKEKRYKIANVGPNPVALLQKACDGADAAGCNSLGLAYGSGS